MSLNQILKQDSVLDCSVRSLKINGFIFNPEDNLQQLNNLTLLNTNINNSINNLVTTITQLNDNVTLLDDRISLLEEKILSLTD